MKYSFYLRFVLNMNNIIFMLENTQPTKISPVGVNNVLNWSTCYFYITIEFHVFFCECFGMFLLLAY